MTRYLVPTLTLLSLTSLAGAEEFVQRNGSATLEIRAPGEGRRLALADVLSVKLTIECETPIDVTAPLDLPTGSPWLLVKRTRPTRNAIDAKLERWQITYEFAPREPGELVFQFPEIRLGSDTTRAWQAETFTVATSIANAENEALRDIIGIEVQHGDIETEATWIYWFIAGMMMLVALVGLMILWRHSRTTHRSPADIALDELARLEEMASPLNAQESARLLLLMSVVRRFLEREFALPARRRTTPEFLELLHQTPHLSANEKRFLTRFFLAMEAVRYAGIAGTASQFTEWLTSVRAFLQARLTDRSESRAK